MFNSKVFLAELIGTFALTFIGAAAGVIGAASNSLGLSVLGTALASGFVYAVFVYAYGPISGSHLNPAVTFGLALNGTVSWARAALYWIAQFVGALLAGFLLNYALTTLGGSAEGGATTGVLTNIASATTQSHILAMVFEAILTFFLVNTILHTAIAGKVLNPLAGWAIGMTLAFSILAGGAFTGASLNPARTFGITLPLAIGSRDFSTLSSPFTYVVYFLGPLIGATLAVLAYNFFQGITDQPDEPIEVEPIPVDETDEAVGE
jgi:MIP family channel proteins